MSSESGTNKILYIKADQNTEVKEPRVSVGDIASVFCADEHIMAKATYTVSTLTPHLTTFL